MLDMSCHLLDLCENSLRANARYIKVRMQITDANYLIVSIDDDGKGMSQDRIQQAMNTPLCEVENASHGRGIPTMREDAVTSGGTFLMRSDPGVGTHTVIMLNLNNPDCIPLGKISSTIRCLLAETGDNVRVKFTVVYGKKEISIDSSKLIKDSGESLIRLISSGKIRKMLEEEIDPVFGG